GANRELANTIAPEIGALIGTACYLLRTLAANEYRALTRINVNVQAICWLGFQRVSKAQNSSKTQREVLILAIEPQKHRLALRTHLGALETNHTGDDRLLVGREVGYRRSQHQITTHPIGALAIRSPSGAVVGRGLLEQSPTVHRQMMRCIGIIEE